MKDMNWPERVAYLENQLADSDRDNRRLREFIEGLPDCDEIERLRGLLLITQLQAGDGSTVNGLTKDQLGRAFRQAQDIARAALGIVTHGDSISGSVNPDQPPTVLTNPWNGEPRDIRDVESDPTGILMVEPGKPLRAADQPDAVLRDAERYRYMRNNASFRDRNGPGLYWYLPRFLPGGGAEQLDAAIDSQLRAADPTTVATAMKHGDYVLATKYDDGDPGDQFAVGHYDRFDCERHYVTDAEGKQFRGNGFRRCEPVTPYEGAWLIAHFPEFVPLELVERDDGEDYLAGKSVWDWLAEARATDQQDSTP
jgi:hypothetical protein